MKVSPEMADSQLQMPGAKKPCTGLGGVSGEVVPPGLVVGPVVGAKATPTPDNAPTSSLDTMTSKDYYFDSYSHFGELP